MEIVELTTKEAMLEQLPIIRQLYPNMTKEKYHDYLSLRSRTNTFVWF